MKTIYKYPLEIVDEQTILMPKDALILQTVQIQNNDVVIWASVNTDNEKVAVTFYTFGTGNKLPEDIKGKLLYIGTYQKNWFVGHVFVKKN
jgi:hypothetical protein